MEYLKPYWLIFWLLIFKGILMFLFRYRSSRCATCVSIPDWCFWLFRFSGRRMEILFTQNSVILNIKGQVQDSTNKHSCEFCCCWMIPWIIYHLLWIYLTHDIGFQCSVCIWWKNYNKTLGKTLITRINTWSYIRATLILSHPNTLSLLLKCNSCSRECRF